MRQWKRSVGSVECIIDDCRRLSLKAKPPYHLRNAVGPDSNLADCAHDEWSGECPASQFRALNDGNWENAALNPKCGSVDNCNCRFYAFRYAMSALAEQLFTLN